MAREIGDRRGRRAGDDGRGHRRGPGSLRPGRGRRRGGCHSRRARPDAGGALGVAGPPPRQARRGGRYAAFDRIRGTAQLGDLADADLVVAAVDGEPTVVQTLFEELGRVCGSGAVPATGGSAPVIECAAASGRPEDVVGMHVVEGPEGGRVVEVVSTVATSADAVEAALALCECLGVRAVRCGDRAGFVVDALLFPYLNDAVRMLSQGYATIDDIDTVMVAGCRYPKGPFEVLDTVGLDVALARQRAMYAASREPGHAPAPLLEQLVTAGFLGISTARGFRTYA